MTSASPRWSVPPYHAVVGASDQHRLGYRRVDDDPNVPVLLDTMDATGEWTATIELRRWERQRLQLVTGERLIDVGCGTGDAGLALGADIGVDGELVGIDSSAAMLEAARGRASNAPCRVRFAVGDALSLDEPDRSFDAARSERTLQWVADPGAAITELVRVLRPAGRLCLIDTDWSTLRLDVGDPEVERSVGAALSVERGRPSNVGRRLAALVREARCTVVGERAATQVWTSWDPDATPAPAGCFSMHSLADDLVERDQIESAEAEGFVEQIQDAARAGRFSMQLTMHAVFATAPSS